jgi:hypothetical protein
MQLLRLIKIVLWGFFGVRKNSGMETDLKANPVQIILVGILAALTFVGVLIAGVKTALHILV